MNDAELPVDTYNRTASTYRKDPFKLGKITKIVSYLHKMFIVCSNESFFVKNACANFSTPYTAHPPTRSETTVTQQVGKREKEI